MKKKFIFLSKMKKKNIITSLLILLIGVISWSGFALAAEKIDAEFEGKVLQIIRENPEVILESVNRYRQEQEQKQQEQKQSFFKNLINNPQQLIANSPTKGAKNGKIILAEFSDFQCPFCAKAAETLTQFMTKHGDEVTLVYKHFPLVAIHDQAVPAASASWAAYQQNQFWPYHDALFTNQNKLGEELYLEIAKNLNLDLEKFNSDRQKAVPEIIKDLEIGEQLGINGTPFFIMNDKTFSGLLSVEQLESILGSLKS